MLKGSFGRREFGWVLTLTMLSVSAGCVGSEGQGRVRSSREGGTGGSPAATRPSWDSIQPAPYQVFERVYSPDSSRVLTRFLVLQAADGDVLSKTLMLALDSLGKADSSLVAARGILYRAIPQSEERATVVPAVWGEWVPPEGWGAATRPEEGAGIHRTFIYRMDPGWGETDTTATAEAENG